MFLCLLLLIQLTFTTLHYLHKYGISVTTVNDFWKLRINYEFVWISKAWNIDACQQTLAKCFIKAGFGQYSKSEDDIPSVFLSNIDESQNEIEAD